MQFPAFLAAGLAFVVVDTAAAQTTFNESEPNDNNATADAIICMVSGDIIAGTSTGAAVSGGGPSTADNFRVQTCAAPAGIYRHQLLYSSTIAAHTTSLRGFNQNTFVIDTTSDIAFITGLTTGPTPRMVGWDGFGKLEEIRYRITGTVSTFSAYNLTLATTPVAPIVIPGAFQAGSIQVSSVGQTTTDTEIYLYDGNFDQVPGGHNDDEGPAGPTPQSNLVRTLTPGVYYVGIQRYEFSNGTSDQNPDEDFVSAIVTALPGAMVCNNNGASGLDLDFIVSDGITTTPVSALSGGLYEIVWATFTVGNPPGFTAFCAGDGTLSDHTTPCPCGNDATTLGNGCGHSFDPGGANLAATGTAAADDVQLQAALMPSTAFTLFIQHDAPADNVFHDGTLCAGGTLIRIRGRQAGIAGQPGPGQAIFPNTNFANDTQTLSQRGQVAVGSGLRRYYAAWYRNASTTFCPPATANVTNGWLIDW